MTLGTIGCGNMSKAILGGAISSNSLPAEQILIKSSTEKSTQATAKLLGVTACFDLDKLVANSDVIIIGVKPGVVAEVLSAVKASGKVTENTLFISIVAGLSLSTLESQLPAGTKIIRTMPNTPTLVGEGMIAYTPNTHCDTKDEEVLKTLLTSAASLAKVPEAHMNAVTGLSGSGPAYVYTFIEALADGAVKEGLPRLQALELAAKTVLGSAKMVLETGIHPAKLRDNVASPGGTTIAGIAALEEHGFRNATIKAVASSAKRSKELS